MRSEGKDLPRTLQLVVGASCFAIQLWWEVPPWVTTMVPMHEKERPKVRDEGQVDSRTWKSVGLHRRKQKLHRRKHKLQRMEQCVSVVKSE